MTRRIIIALTTTLIAPVIEKLLDAMGISEEDSKLVREVAKAVIVTIIAVLIEETLSDAESRS
jgi:hypothetical protein